MALVTGGRKVSARGRIGILVVIMTSVSLITGGSALHLLYRAAFAQQEMRLVEMAQSQARLIEAVGQVDAMHTQEHHPSGATAATLSQTIEAPKNSRGLWGNC